MKNSKTGSSSASANSPVKRDFVGMLFRCCGVYARLYLRSDGQAYAGRCPKCANPVSIHASEGKKCRFFDYG